jgi:hypothetical protein
VRRRFKSLTPVNTLDLHSSDKGFIKPHFHEQICWQGDSFLERVRSKYLRMFSETQRLSKASDHTGTGSERRSSLFRRVASLRKATTSSRLYVCPPARPPARPHGIGSHWTDFQEILYLISFLKSVKKIKVSLISDNNTGYFAWRPMCIYDSISFSCS